MLSTSTSVSQLWPSLDDTSHPKLDRAQYCLLDDEITKIMTKMFQKTVTFSIYVYLLT